MAINTFATLKTAMTNNLIVVYDDARLEEWIVEAEAEINRRLMGAGGIRDMEVSADLTITAGTRTVSLPTRYRGMRRLYLDLSPVRKLDFVPSVDYWARYMSSETGRPVAFTIEADDIVLGPSPDTGYTGKILFWQAFEALSDSATTNDLLTNNPDLYLYAALKHAYIFKHDKDEIAFYESLVAGIIADIKAANRRDRYSGDALVIRTDRGSPPQF